MDGVSRAAVANSIESVNQVLQNATEKTLAMSKKMVAVSVEMALAPEAGKGAAIDTVG